MRANNVYICTLFALSLSVAGCGLFEEQTGQEFASISVLSGKVAAYDYSAGSKGELIAEETFNNKDKKPSERSFSIELKKTNEPVLIELTGAQVEDWATLDVLTFDAGDRWMTLLPRVEDDARFVITPLTTIASRKAIHHIQKEIEPPPGKVEELIASVTAAFSQHFGSIAFTELEPASLSQKVGNITANVKQSLFLAGYSQLIRDYSTFAGLTPNKVLNVVTVTDRLCDDALDDGIFDGQGALGTINLAGVSLSDRTLRIDLAMGMVRFLDNQTVNKSGIASQDVIALGNEVATNIDASLFPQNTPVFTIDLDPPTIEVLQPIGSNPILSSIVSLQILGADEASDISSIQVDLLQIGSEITFVEELIDEENAPELFEAQLFTTIYDNGSYLLSIAVQDSLGNEATDTYGFSISN